MNRLPMHEALKPLAWLEGTWQTEVAGAGKFPTIKPFQYSGRITFESIGEPMFNYASYTWHPETLIPMHRETGALKIIPDTNRVSLVLYHSFGVATIEEGEVVINHNVIYLKSTSILRQTVGIKEPVVTEIQRELRLEDERLQQIVYMATSTTPDVTEHLRATYVKQS